MRKKTICLLTSLLAILCLISGCGQTTAEPEKTSGTTDESTAPDLSGLFDGGGPTETGFGFGWPDERDVFDYIGEPLEVPFMLTGGSAEPFEEGLILLVDGIAQPYSVTFSDGTTLPEAYVQTFTLKQDEENIFNLVFQPVTGQKGDTLSMQAVLIYNPGFLPNSADNPRYGINHQSSVTIPLQIALQADAPQVATSSANYETVDIPQSVYDADQALGMEAGNGIDLMDQNSALQIVPVKDENGNVIRSENGKAAFYIRFYGGPEAQINFSLFVNHRKVEIGSADYLTAKTQRGKMTQALITLDTTELPELSTIYAVAASTGVDSGLTETVKSDSVLLVNEEG